MKTVPWSGLLLSFPLAIAALAAAAHAQATGGPTLSSDLRDEYLTGESVRIRIEARNDSGQAITIPDLSARFDLVRFEMKFPDGQTQNRLSHPEVPATQTWNIPPRGAREVLLELPASSTLKPGAYQMAIHVRLSDTDERTLSPRTLRLAEPNPVSADLFASAQPSERTSDLIPWVHQGTGGYDLYLFSAENSAPNVRLAQDHLARLSSAISPALTAARAGETAGRYLVWLEGERRLHYASLQDHRLDGPPRSIEAPWPRITLAAQGATTLDGALLQPLWIPAPSGNAGELRVATVLGRDNAAYRRVGRYTARPEVIRSLVDDAGTFHLLIVHGGQADLHTVKTGADLALAAKENLPVPGRRLHDAPSDIPILDARFATLQRTETFAGGIALLLLERSSPEVLTPRWFTLGGQPLLDAAPLTLPSGARLIDISPAGTGTVGALMRLASGELRYVEGGKYVTLTGISGEMALDRDRAGRPLVRALGKPLLIRPLAPETPLPSP